MPALQATTKGADVLISIVKDSLDQSVLSIAYPYNFSQGISSSPGKTTAREVHSHQRRVILYVITEDCKMKSMHLASQGTKSEINKHIKRIVPGLKTPVL